MKLSKKLSRINVDILGLKGEEMPKLFTACPMPSLNERNNKMIIVNGAEPLIYDDRLKVVDLFSGCGGMSLGLVNAGLRIVASVENDDMAHLTYAYNIPTYQKAPIHCYNMDIRKLSGYTILANLGLKSGEVDLVVGSPPCQGFSYAGKRKISDERDLLLFEFKRLIKEINPKCWVMENVPGIRTKKFQDGTLVLDKFLEGMNQNEESK